MAEFWQGSQLCGVSAERDSGARHAGSLQACAVQCGQLQRGHERLFCQYADCPRVHMVGDCAAEYAWRAWRADAALGWNACQSVSEEEVTGPKADSGENALLSAGKAGKG